MEKCDRHHFTSRLSGRKSITSLSLKFKCSFIFFKQTTHDFFLTRQKLFLFQDICLLKFCYRKTLEDVFLFFFLLSFSHEPVADCIVDDFGPWSACDTECGRGSMSRERKVIQETRNGGKPCPELIQKRSCVGLNCENPRAAVKASKGNNNSITSTTSYLSLD